MNIKTKDLNMLLIFQTMMQEKNASRAATRLSMSQPALSHALKKLRRDFNDPLFVRKSKGMAPTPRAIELYPQINQLIEDITQVYTQHEKDHLPEAFDRQITIHTTDYMQALLLPRLLKEIRSKAPNLTVVVKDINGKLPKRQLEIGQCDLTIAGFFDDLPSTYYQQALTIERFVTLYDSNYHDFDAVTGPVLSQYLAAPHLMTTLTGDMIGIVDQVLKNYNKVGDEPVRNIVAGVSSFLAIADILSDSPYLVTCLNSLAVRAQYLYPNLTMSPCPVDLPEVKVTQVWHQRTHNDPVMKWVRNIIYEIMSPSRVEEKQALN